MTNLELEYFNEFNRLGMAKQIRNLLSFKYNCYEISDRDGIVTHTLLDRKDCTNALSWSKTTLTTGGVGRAGVDPPP